jgi:hypothetical protein
VVKRVPLFFEQSCPGFKAADIIVDAENAIPWGRLVRCHVCSRVLIYKWLLLRSSLSIGFVHLNDIRLGFVNYEAHVSKAGNVLILHME